jgi:tripartite-type tricarboxylate transporter receptor subunit TctC
MTISRRTLLQLPLATLPIAGTGFAWAQQYPTKPVRLIVGASAGTTVDVTARYVADVLSKRLNQAFLVDNRPGAGGAIGSDAVAKAPADGYTLGFAGITHFASRYSGDATTGYDPVKDFTGIARICSAALAIVVPANSPYRTLQELVQAMKNKPGEVDYGSGGMGSTSHLCTVILNDLTQTKAKHIPYKGNTQAVTDTVAGIVAFTAQGSGGVLPLIKAGKLRALAVTSRNRWEALPEVPTGIEAGVPGFEVASWMGALGPASTPPAVAQLISSELALIARSPEFKAFCDKQSMYIELVEHQQFHADLPREDAHWKRVSQLTRA